MEVFFVSFHPPTLRPLDTYVKAWDCWQMSDTRAYRTEHTPEHPCALNQRWTTRAQVKGLLSHPTIRELWEALPDKKCIAADPCAGDGRLAQHVQDVCEILKMPAPWCWQLSTLETEHEHPDVITDVSRVVDGKRQWQRVLTFYDRGVDAARLWKHNDVRLVITNLPWYGVFARLVGHWRDVAFPNALIIALCDDGERTRKPAIKWLSEGNMPAYQCWLPGRQHISGADDGDYPWPCSWYIWRSGERRTTTTTLQLEMI